MPPGKTGLLSRNRWVMHRRLTVAEYQQTDDVGLDGIPAPELCPGVAIPVAATFG